MADRSWRLVPMNARQRGAIWKAARALVEPDTAEVIGALFDAYEDAITRREGIELKATIARGRSVLPERHRIEMRVFDKLEAVFPERRSEVGGVSGSAPIEHNPADLRAAFQEDK